MILAYASLLRHGLIPNLMDGGKNPRYNARDATWWFLHAVQDYCEMAPDGLKLLSAAVHRRFSSDVQSEAEGHPRKPPAQPLASVLLEIFRKHAAGAAPRAGGAHVGAAPARAFDDVCAHARRY